MKPVKIIALGSPFADDQLGWHANEILQQQLSQAPVLSSNVTLCYLDRPGVALIDELIDADFFFLIDAVQANGQVGDCYRFTAQQLLQQQQPVISTHDVGVIQALALADTLQRLPEHVIIYALEIGVQLQAHFSLSAVIQDKLGHLCRQLLAEISKSILTLGDR